jgi:thiosulfate/3-mercaptopyruvate sulfurtransferase
MSDKADPAVLVSTEWVASRLSDPSIHLVELDEDTEAYDRGHLEGAVALHWRDELQHRVRRDFVGADDFAALVGSRGIGEDDTVVLYGGNNNWFAAYGYWYFKYYGHRDVRLMDGGRKKWELEQRPLTTDVPEVQPRTYRVGAVDTSIRALREEVLSEAGKVHLVDVRSPEEFVGTLAAPAHLPQEQAQRKGHIPRAVNVPWSKAANEDGTFRSADELRALYLGDAHLSADDPVIAYCRIGERSSHTWFVLRELLGFANVRNYDGSWTEYGSMVGLPIELGPAHRDAAEPAAVR